MAAICLSLNVLNQGFWPSFVFVFVCLIGVIPNVCHIIRADSRFAPSQWETSLQSNTIPHWLGTGLESALKYIIHVTLSP